MAVLMPGDGSDIVENRDILLNTSNGKVLHMNELHPSYDPLQYVLLFPTGDFGYHPNIDYRIASSSKISCREYYAYKLMVRKNDDTIHRSKRLFCQYIVDMYAKQEHFRLTWVRLHQKDLRADLYQGIVDAVNSDNDISATNIGKRIILPSTFTGSPRQMHKMFQDGMAIVRKYGKPSLFITFTGNPQWEEIKKELLPGQVSNDRPDLICRVFHMMLTKFFDDLFKREVFGKVAGYCSVIEFQKRGNFTKDYYNYIILR